MTENIKKQKQNRPRLYPKLRILSTFDMLFRCIIFTSLLFFAGYPIIIPLSSWPVKVLGLCVCVYVPLAADELLQSV